MSLMGLQVRWKRDEHEESENIPNWSREVVEGATVELLTSSRLSSSCCGRCYRTRTARRGSTSNRTTWVCASSFSSALNACPQPVFPHASFGISFAIARL